MNGSIVCGAAGGWVLLCWCVMTFPGRYLHPMDVQPVPSWLARAGGVLVLAGLIGFLLAVLTSPLMAPNGPMPRLNPESAPRPEPSGCLVGFWIFLGAAVIALLCGFAAPDSQGRWYPLGMTGLAAVLLPFRSVIERWTGTSG